MSVRFSLVYPTRHRPAFIKEAIRFLERQEYPNFEVIVSDNYEDPALSCETECRNSSLTNLKYVRPSKPLSMVENWNYGVQFASGDYICYFTDKMFLLPKTLSLTSKCIEGSRPEIISWADNMYTPSRFPDYFGKGLYSEVPAPVGRDFLKFGPLKELSSKGNAPVARSEQDKWSYARGKICFGAYSAELCSRIIQRTGALFHAVSPDYTSMILALSMAKSAMQLCAAGIVHVNTDLSNGGQAAVRDELALQHLNLLDKPEEILLELLVPGMYCSPHNVVARDYLALKKRFGLDFQFDLINWLVYSAEDLDIPGRQWSSAAVENQQRQLLQDFIASLSAKNQQAYRERLRWRQQKREKDAQRRLAKTGKRKQYVRKAARITKAILPKGVIEPLSGWLSAALARKHSTGRVMTSQSCSSLEEILK